MSQESHSDPEKYYQGSLHRVQITDAFREEMRDERKDDMEDDRMDIKILEYLIDGSHDINIDEAREQLDALIANQIPGRCKDCNHYDDACMYLDKNMSSNDYCSYFTKREA